MAASSGFFFLCLAFLHHFMYACVYVSLCVFRCISVSLYLSVSLSLSFFLLTLPGSLVLFPASLICLSAHHHFGLEIITYIPDIITSHSTTFALPMSYSMISKKTHPHHPCHPHIFSFTNRPFHAPFHPSSFPSSSLFFPILSLFIPFAPSTPLHPTSHLPCARLLGRHRASQE